MTFPAATNQPRSVRTRSMRMSWLLVLATAACGTPEASYTPGKLSKEQMARCRAVAQAYVDSSDDYPELRDGLRDDPIALQWYVRYLESEIVHAREGRSELLGEKKVRMDRIKEATRSGKKQVPWNLPGQHADTRAVGQIIEIGEPAIDVVVNDLVLAEQEFLRQIGVDLLAGIGDAAVPALLQLASTGDQKQQRAAARALGEVGAKGPSFEALKQLAGSSDWQTRSGAAMALANGGGEARELLVSMLGDEDPFVRRKAGESLANYKDRRAATALVDYLEQCKRQEDWNGEMAAQKALQMIAGSKGPRAAAAWRRFADEMPAGEGGR